MYFIINDDGAVVARFRSSSRSSLSFYDIQMQKAEESAAKTKTQSLGCSGSYCKGMVQLKLLKRVPKLRDLAESSG